MICFGFILYPISEHSFHMKAIKKLYIAKTSNESLFRKSKSKCKKSKKDSKNAMVQTLQHKSINVTLFQSSSLYLRNTLAEYFPILFEKRTQLQKLYEVGTEKLDHEMNLVKIVKNLKFLRILMKKHLTDEKLQFEIRHDKKKCNRP